MSFGSQSSLPKDRKEIVKKWTNFTFSSLSEYLMITFACSFTVPNIYRFITMQDNLFYPNIVQHAICYFIVGLPYTYMQIVMSQYSQLGVVLFKNICPLSNGIGYTMIIISIFWCCYFGMELGDMILYLLICMESNIYWTECPADTKNRCWDTNSSCTDSCLSENVQTSAYVYWNETFMGKVNLSQINMEIGQPIVARVVTMILGWIIIYSMLSTGIETYKKVIRINCYMIFTCFAVVLLVSSVHDGGLDGMTLIFTNIQGASFISFTSWIVALKNVIHSLSLAKVCHMMYGTYINPKTSSTLIAIFVILINFFVGFAGLLTAQSSLGIIMNYSKIDSKGIKYIWKNGTAASLTIIPEGLGLLGVPQLWNLIYFFACILILLNNLISQLDAIERAIIDAHPKIITYRYYLLTALCILCALYGFIFSSTVAYPGVIDIFYSVIIHIEIQLMFLTSIIMFWIYGVQRISDDIHFLNGLQPSKFWILSWYITPVLFGLCFLKLSFGKKAKTDFLAHSIYQSFMYLIIISPIPVLTVYELFHYLKMHKLVSIMQPEERWGPSDPEERYLRRLFNPREEIRSRRRDNTCPHSCLIENQYKEQIVHEENILRRAEENNIQTNTSSEALERLYIHKDMFSSSTEFIDN